MRHKVFGMSVTGKAQLATAPLCPSKWTAGLVPPGSIRKTQTHRPLPDPLDRNLHFPFGHAAWHVGSSFPSFLTTGPPRKSHQSFQDWMFSVVHWVPLHPTFPLSHLCPLPSQSPAFSASRKHMLLRHSRPSSRVLEMQVTLTAWTPGPPLTWLGWGG